MPIQSLFRHTLTVQRATAGAVSPRGHAAEAWATSSTFRGRLEEVAAYEVSGPTLVGTVVANAKVYAPIATDVTEKDRIGFGAAVYDVLAVRDAGGAGGHLEMDARRVRG